MKAISIVGEESEMCVVVDVCLLSILILKIQIGPPSLRVDSCSSSSSSTLANTFMISVHLYCYGINKIIFTSVPGLL